MAINVAKIQVVDLAFDRSSSFTNKRHEQKIRKERVASGGHFLLTHYIIDYVVFGFKIFFKKLLLWSPP